MVQDILIKLITLLLDIINRRRGRKTLDDITGEFNASPETEEKLNLQLKQHSQYSPSPVRDTRTSPKLNTSDRGRTRTLAVAPTYYQPAYDYKNCDKSPLSDTETSNSKFNKLLKSPTIEKTTKSSMKKPYTGPFATTKNVEIDTTTNKNTRLSYVQSQAENNVFSEPDLLSADEMRKDIQRSKANYMEPVTSSQARIIPAMKYITKHKERTPKGNDSPILPFSELLSSTKADIMEIEDTFQGCESYSNDCSATENNTAMNRSSDFDVFLIDDKTIAHEHELTIEKSASTPDKESASNIILIEDSSSAIVRGTLDSDIILIEDSHSAIDRETFASGIIIIEDSTPVIVKEVRDILTPVHNNIVSILKKKDFESSSASSNASPVTFSPSVIDTPIRSSVKQGILKKRCSLDESRYSRSHSPDERGILVKGNRRNSFEELQHGILKQSSYDSKDDVSSSSTIVSHGILKKKESITPSEQQKHVSISQAVILAAAELCKTISDHDDSDYVRPILKSDQQAVATPRPILKKKYSSENEEIRPILKTSSRKSSREESSDNEDCKNKSILNCDSPVKRRSYCDSFESDLIFQRSKSFENHESKNDGIGTTVSSIETPIVSVAERIRSMEKFSDSSSSSAVLGAVPKSSSRRDNIRFKTQPVTVGEISR